MAREAAKTISTVDAMVFATKVYLKRCFPNAHTTVEIYSSPVDLMYYMDILVSRNGNATIVRQAVGDQMVDLTIDRFEISDETHATLMLLAG